MHYPMTDLMRNAEASRYALLRRLAPPMRHQIAGSLQPVAMMAALIEKRLKAATPDLPAVAKSTSDMKALAGAATRSNLDLMDWIACAPGSRVPLDKGIKDALDIVATELSFRGFKCVNQTDGATAAVALTHTRGVFVAGLLALTDACAKPASLLLTAARAGEAMVLTIEVTDNATEPGVAPHDEFHVSPATYRKIGWDDAQAIAAADGAGLTYAATNLVLGLPLISG
jgi:hypothetical protein